MIRFIAREMENYASEQSYPESKLFKALVEETYAQTKWPQMQVGHLEGVFLRMLVRLTRAKKILEIGTFTGYSALAMAEALPPEGRLWTCDVNPRSTQIAEKFWSRSAHGKKIQLVLGPALETVPKIKKKFDMVFVDADKENVARYWDLCLPKLHRGGVMVVDNTFWSGRVLAPKAKSDKAMAAFNQKVARDKRVEAVMLTVRDGMTLAWKK